VKGQKIVLNHDQLILIWIKIKLINYQIENYVLQDIMQEQISLFE